MWNHTSSQLPEQGVLVEVKLLSACGYPDMTHVDFPVKVLGRMDGSTFDIKGTEIIRIAGQVDSDPWDPEFWYAFLVEDIEFIEGGDYD